MLTPLFFECRDQVGDVGLGGVDFALAVGDKLLKLKSDRLGSAEVLPFGINAYPHFFAHAKEVVDGVAAGKNEGLKITQGNFLLAEFRSRNPFYLNEGPKVDLNLVLFGQEQVGVIARLGLRLGDQNALYFALAFSQ